MSSDHQPPAVIYCRVSDKKQKSQGNGLDSQEKRCREFASRKGYRVVQTFHDDFTGQTSDRPAIKEMMAYLKKKKIAHFVIVDDLSRIARDVEAHTQLRRMVKTIGSFMASPSHEFREDPDGRFHENILASSYQHQREKNAETTLNRMKARVANGYYVFAKPIGYSYRMVNGRGRMLFRNEPYATIITEALEGFASGRFGSQAEVVRFLEAQPEYPKDRNGHVLFQHVNALLTRPVYAGMVEAPNWNIGITKGHHPALISYESYLKIQDRLKVKSVAPARKDISAEFPLRGVVVCHDCGTQLTSCYSKGRSKWYAIYFCFKKHCPSYRKSIRREKLEGDFEAILQQLQPSREIFGLAVALLKDWWDVRQASSKTRRQSVEDELRSNERAINQLLDRIIEADNPTVIKAYENRLRLLEQSKALCAEKAANLGRPKGDFEKTVRSALVFLASPCEIYKNG